MKIAIDVMGAENSPNAMIDATLEKSSVTDYDFYLYGDEKIIKNYLKDKNYKKDKINIISCSKVIDANCEIRTILKENKDSSMIRALSDINEKKVDVVVSSGSTASLLAGATLGVGRIKGIKRPALSAIFPSYEFGQKIILDVGANAEVTPLILNQFALMGHFYAQFILNIKNPKIGLINIGEEETKGTQIYKEAYELLKNNDIINFVGNFEPYFIANGSNNCDVYICDGFTGNIILKSSEGFLKMFSKALKNMIYKNTKTKIAGLLMKSELNNFKSIFTDGLVMGAPLLGIKEVVVKAHGNADKSDFLEAIDFAIKYKEAKIIEKLETALNSNKNE